VLDRPRPEPAPGEALVRTLRVGVDGTDHEVVAGGHGAVPEGEDHLVLGNGPLGLLTLAMLDGFERTYCLGRRDRPDPSVDLIEAVGATDVDAREMPVDDIPEAYEPMDLVYEPLDLVYEATGYARHAFEGIRATAPAGVLALLGVPGDWTFEVDGGALHRDLVVNNKAVVGSVNSGVGHFRAAIDTLAGLDDGFLEAFVTGVHDVSSFERAFADDERTIKTAVEFARV
jgi:threonine dehydrogenase-like Zn-dependent dehydrogenase